MNEKMRFCALIPAYREGRHIGEVVRAVLKHGCDVIVVDDGSPDDTVAVAEQAGAIVIRHEINKGKGAAIETGLAEVVKRGYDFVITMDADGQHDPADMEGLIKAYCPGGFKVVVGSRMADPAGMPLVRRLTNRFMSWLLSREMGQRVPDTQSGYRLYARDVIKFLKTGSTRFAAESEVLLELADAGIEIGSAPIKVIYGDEKSKINPFRDTIRFFSMLNKYRGRRGRSGEGNCRLPIAD